MKGRLRRLHAMYGDDPSKGLSTQARLKRIAALCVEHGFPFPDGERPLVVMFRPEHAAELYRLARGPLPKPPGRRVKKQRERA